MHFVESGRPSFEPIDQAVRSAGFRMGPFELMDLIGLDVNLSIYRILYESLGRPESLRPHLFQEKLVERGHLGRKSRSGFYLYQENKQAGVNPEAQKLAGKPALPLGDAEILDRILQGISREAEKAFQEGVAGREDIDTAMKLGFNWPKGPFEWEKENSPTS